LSRGYELHVDEEAEHGDLREDVETDLDRLGAIESLQLALQWDRAFGGSALLLGLHTEHGPADLSEPLPNGFPGVLTYVSPLDPTELVPAYADPTTGRTTHYRLASSTTISHYGGDPLNRVLPPGMPIIHADRLIMFGGVRVSPHHHGTANAWCGDSVLVRVLGSLSATDAAFASANYLLADHGVAAVKIKELAKMINANRFDVVRARMTVLLQGISAARAMILDAEEDVTRVASPLTEVAAILDRIEGRLCAAAELPRTILFGDSPGGLGSNGQGELEALYRSVEVYQRQRVRPALRRLLDVAIRASGYDLPKKWDVKFCPLWVPSAKEVAETRNTMASADNVYLQNGVLSPEEVRRSRFAGEYSMETSVSMDDGAPDIAVNAPITDEEREILRGDTPPAPDAPTTPTPGKPTTKIADVSMTGIQVTSMMEIVKSYIRRELPRESAKAILLAAFTAVDESEAESMLGPPDYVAPAPAPTPANANAPQPPSTEPTDKKPNEST
jgi:phage-related protein (TIGR01555 family)